MEIACSACWYCEIAATRRRVIKTLKIELFHFRTQQIVPAKNSSD
jgi:hypothetical protein